MNISKRESRKIAGHKVISPLVVYYACTNNDFIGVRKKTQARRERGMEPKVFLHRARKIYGETKRRRRADLEPDSVSATRWRWRWRWRKPLTAFSLVAVW